MALTSNILSLITRGRREEIDHFRRHPVEVQHSQLEYLLEMGANTVYGQQFGMGTVQNIEQFQARVPVAGYEHFSPLIHRTMMGEHGLLWPTDIRWFARSSGTTDNRSKYIPVTDEGLEDCHFQGPRDVMGLYVGNFPDSNAFSGKTLTLGGSRKVIEQGTGAKTGDLSAILIENMPRWLQWRREPSLETSLLPDFDEKVERICQESLSENVTSFAGVPSWNLVMMNRILDYTGKRHLHEVWPEMELFMHGGMNFAPYREQYKKLFPDPRMKYMETFNASEGFFAVADQPGSGDMLLMLDYKIFYEFLPVDSLDDHSKAVPLEGVHTGENYAMIITSSNGLWRYLIGDVVEFTSVEPYRIRIAGRTRNYINVFGEELMIDNAEAAVSRACQATGAGVSEYSAGPVYMQGRGKGAHQWVIEFTDRPFDIELFSRTLDMVLREVNSDYDAKRTGDATLRAPVITAVPQGTFMEWMKLNGKVGGQNKVPRLSNDRKMVEELLGIAGRL